jgi:hypothetical protein
MSESLGRKETQMCGPPIYHDFLNQTFLEHHPLEDEA